MDETQKSSNSGWFLSFSFILQVLEYEMFTVPWGSGTGNGTALSPYT
jgi:hypothetical protein